MQVVQCERSQLALAIKTADVAVPLMSRLDEQVREDACCCMLFLPPVAACAAAAATAACRHNCFT